MGHPINRNRKKHNELKSSIFLGDRLNLINIHYIKYERNSENSFKATKSEYPVSKVIDEHLDYLEEYFGIILKKINEIKIILKNKINDLKNLIDNYQRLKTKENLEKLLDNTRRFFEDFTNTPPFSKKILMNCFERKEKHPGDEVEIEIENFISKLTSFLDYLPQFLEEEKVSDEIKNIEISLNLTDELKI